jgi:hypothetical protein
MIRKAILVVTVTGAVLALAGYALYLGNVAPLVAAVSVDEAARADKPYVRAA